MPVRTLAAAAALFAAAAVHAQIEPPAPVAPSPPDYAYDGSPRVDLSGPPDFQGTLTDQDPVYADRNAPMDTYTFAVTAGDEVTVTMTSATFDTYLVVRAPSGGGEWTNDDYGSTRVSQVSFVAQTGGRYTIVATAFSESGRGDYEIRTRAGRPVLLSTTAGRLDYQDQQSIKGEFYDTVQVRSPQSGPFYVELRPLGFPGYVRVTSPSGVQATGTAPYDARAIRVGPLQAEAGAWTVDVTSDGFGPQVGAYDVVVLTLDD